MTLAESDLSTLVDEWLDWDQAAARLEVGFIGIELDEHYLKEAIARARAELR